MVHSGRRGQRHAEGPWREQVRTGARRAFPPEAVESSVGARFEHMASTFPDATAVRSPSVEWTYAELDEQVRRIGAGVAARCAGSSAPRPVAVLADHDGPLVAAVLGIIRAGQIVVILDPVAPLEQGRAVVREAAPEVLLHDVTHAELAADLARGGDVALWSLDEVDGEPVAPAARTAESPVMLAFTSGTSGGPKGAVISHGVLLNTVRGATDALGVDAADLMPMLFPTSLAVAAYPMFIPLLNGGTLSTLDVRSVGLAPVADFLRDERITLAYMAPTVVRFLVDSLAGIEFPDMRLVALGGELVDPDVLALTAQLFDVEHVAVGYGTTETGVVSLAVYASEDIPPPSVTCGYPADEVEIAILDTDGIAVPAGTSGEVAVLSRHLFEGYWGHPELGRQVLTDVEGPHRLRCYRTGDLGRLDEDGALVLLGRNDTKVKVRGRFVVLGDVEADLKEQPSVLDAAVTARTVDGIAELVAYVVLDPDQDAGPNDLRAALLDRREAYSVPTRWVPLDELPRLPNGKTDRRALPSPDLVHRESTPDDRVFTSAGSSDDLRRAIRDLWEDMLPVGAVGMDEDFMTLGGDSLLAAQMLVALERRVGVAVPMGSLVHARTVRDLAEVVGALSVQADSDTTTAACVQPGDLSTRPRLWFVHDLQGSAYRVRHVAAALGSDQPVWSFESPLLLGEPDPHRSLDSFAANYLTDLRRVQPTGPYWLAGYSFGGICAYEMARQLRRDGEEVAFVGVIDVGPGYRGTGWSNRRSPRRPWFGIAPPPPAGSGLIGAAGHYREMFASSRRGALRHLMVRFDLYRIVDPIRFRLDLHRRGRVRPEWRLWYAWEEHWKLAATAWDRSNTYAGKLDLFWADATASADATMGWGPLVGELAVHRFAGDHAGALEPDGADELAAALRRVMDNALDGEPS